MVEELTMVAQEFQFGRLELRKLEVVQRLGPGPESDTFLLLSLHRVAEPRVLVLIQVHRRRRFLM
jgi:hypothetical protein